MSQIDTGNPLATNMGEERGLLQECIHCGFCLPACPTYIVNGKEMDSPRGRLYLIEAATQSRIGVSDSLFQHIDLCLACRGCETACPSGVQFGHLMEMTRSRLMPSRSVRELSSRLSGFLLKRIVPSHGALSFLFGLARFYQVTGLHRLMNTSPLSHLLPKRTRVLQQSLVPIPAKRFGRGKTSIYPSLSERRGKVALFAGCIADHLFPEVHHATIRLLRRNGWEVIVPGGQTCCGALHVHAGDRETAASLAERNLSAFDIRDLDAIIVNAAGCGAHLKNYDRFVHNKNSLGFTKKVKDLTEFLVLSSMHEPQMSLDVSVVYDEPCHLVHGQGITAEPKQLIETIPGVRLLPLQESDVCCGSAGSYAITQTAMSMDVLERKIDCIEQTGADAIITANPGCQIQLQWGVRLRKLNMRVLHIAELLDQAYQDVPARLG